VRYLLDTNIASDMIRHPAGRPARRYRAVGYGSVSISAIVAAELRFGAAKRADADLSGRVSEFIEAVDVIPFGPPADEAYGILRASLETSGRVIGGVDLFIAAHALALHRILVTDNVREFSRIDGLAVENWLG
jgi:tRNA(fMet)-specific endonuclease VapC